MAIHNPLHPGLIVKDALINNTSLTVTEAATRLGVARPTISRLLNGQSGISPEVALRLSKLFGNSVDFWLNLQMHYDAWQVQQYADEIEVDQLDDAA